MTTTITIGPTPTGHHRRPARRHRQRPAGPAHLMQHSGGVVTMPSGRIATAAYITRARLTLAYVRALFTAPTLRNPRVNSPEGFHGNN